MNGFISNYINESIEILKKLDIECVEQLAEELVTLRDRMGRLFILGVGGSAANANHAVNDFRKLCNIEAYAPTDNISELTARINDNGWDDCFVDWLKGSMFNSNDGILIFSVGGGNKKKEVSVNIVKALEYGQKIGASIFGIVSRDGGYTLKVAHKCILIPVVTKERITPHAEGICSIIWHILVSHPKLQITKTKWESIK
ncbi:MAG: SIS domain-containing protein [bacterium]